MIQFLLVILSVLEFWILFTICYALAKKDQEGEPIIDRKLPVFAILLFGIIYVLINLFFLI